MQLERPSSLGTWLVRKIVSRLACGSLTIVLPDGQEVMQGGPRPGPEGVLVMHRWRVLQRLLLGGDIGFAESYMDGDWRSPDIAALIELAARNMAALPGTTGGGPLPARLLLRLQHMARANTLSGSRRNIKAHYDLGNEFYGHWLDGGMQYSAAPFEDPAASLETAQAAKLDRIVDLLGLEPGQKVLEIGFGWGGLVERMIREGVHATGLTLSPAQHAYATARLEAAGLSDRAELRLQDYRLCEGQFDRIVSIEMLEAVGEARWPVYFDRLRRLLKPGGTVVLQCITIADHSFDGYRRNPDFIQRHIFPGGMLPSPTALRAELARAGFVVHQVQNFGAGYARTLRHWQQRFETAWPEIARLGFSPRFKRMWEYYLGYCVGGFDAENVDVGLWQLSAG